MGNPNCCFMIIAGTFFFSSQSPRGTVYEIKKNFVIIFQEENGNTFTFLIIFIVKYLQKEQNSTNLLLWPPICLYKSAITPKWFNSLDTNSTYLGHKMKVEFLEKLDYRKSALEIFWPLVSRFLIMVGCSLFDCLVMVKNED